MNDTANKPVEPELVLKTPEELAEELKAADFITVDLINETKANPPALQSAELEAAHTFKVVNGYLKTLRAAYELVIIDTTTSAGLAFAKDARYKLKTLRTRSEKLRVESNEPFASRIKAHNDAQKMVEDAILPLEQRFDEAIKAHERAVAQRKLDEEAAAALKAANITAAINGISAKADDVMDLNSGELAARIQEVTLHDLNEEELGARFAEAVSIKDRTIAKLEAAHAKALTNEENARQVLADRERHEKDRKEREEREASEREARKEIGVLNDMLAFASSKSVDELTDDIDALEKINISHYAPLEAEAQQAVDRALPVLRQTRFAKIAEADRLKAEIEATAKREKETAARQRIADIKALVVDSLGVGSDAIKANIAKLDDLLRADFDPFAAEAEAEQERVRPMLQKFLEDAEAAERTAAEKQAEADRLAAEQQAAAARKQAIEDALALLEGTARRAELSAMPSKSLRAEIDALKDEASYTEAVYGDRVQEARDIAADEVGALEELFDKVKAAEVKVETDAAEAKVREDKEREEKALRSRFTRALAENAVHLFDTMRAVLADEGFAGLQNETRLKVIGVLASVEQATRTTD